MAIYDKNGDVLASVYDSDGVSLATAYDVNGDICFSDSMGYYERKFSTYVDGYIRDNGLYIDGVPSTKEEITEWILNRNNCIYRGKLSKSGQYLVDKDGNNIDLQGIGTHHLTQYSNLHTLNSLRILKYCGINCVRMSAYLLNHDFTYSDGQSAPGYIPSPDAIKAEMDKIIGYCIELGLYVIVDWHVWSGGGERLNTSDAVEFFTYFANKYHNIDNVLYELANEPFSDTLANIVTHCTTLRTLIKSYVTDPVLICGVRIYNNGATELYNALQAENIDDIFISQHRY